MGPTLLRRIVRALRPSAKVPRLEPWEEELIEAVQKRLVYDDTYAILTEQLGREPHLREIMEYMYGD